MHNSNNSALSKDTIFGASNHTNINSVFNSALTLEEVSVTKAKEALLLKVISPKEALQILKNLETRREAIRIFEERKQSEENLKKIIDQLPSNITETPKFHEDKSECVELSDCTRKTFARIGARAREAFIEDQIERAMAYNIPYETYGNNYYQLMQDIGRYEYLLEQAEELGIYFDTSEYDPVFLEQLIEEREEEARNERNQLHYDYYSSRRVAV